MLPEAVFQALVTRRPFNQTFQFPDEGISGAIALKGDIHHLNLDLVSAEMTYRIRNGRGDFDPTIFTSVLARILPLTMLDQLFTINLALVDPAFLEVVVGPSLSYPPVNALVVYREGQADHVHLLVPENGVLRIPSLVLHVYSDIFDSLHDAIEDVGVSLI